jgi:CBS domain-containing protein
MSLQKFCRKPVAKISADVSIVEACRMLEERNVGCLVVESDGKLCGVVTDRDIALKVTGAQRDPQKTTVREIMTADPIRVFEDRDLHHLTSLMRTYHVRRVPIVNEDHKTVGIVTLDDLIALLGEEMSDVGKAIAEGFPQENSFIEGPKRAI